MNIAEILRNSSKAYTDEPAIIFNNQPYLSFQKLHQRVASLAGYMLNTLAVKPGSRVAIIMENRPEYVEVMFAAWYAGLAVVPMNAKLHISDFIYILDNSGASLCFSSNKFCSVLGKSKSSQLPETVGNLVNVDSPDFIEARQTDPVEITPRGMNELAWLFYTSGTTGKPKGAMLSHRNLYFMLDAFLAQVKAVECGDYLYHGAPMSHGSGFYILPYISRGGAQIIPQSGGFDVAELIDICRHYSGVSFFAAPTMVKRLIEDPLASSGNLSSIDTIIYGGGPMYQATLEKAHAMLGNKLVQTYGQGECPMTITVLDRYQHGVNDHPRYKKHLNSVGFPYFKTEIKIVDSNDNTLSCGEVGEILVKSDAVMSGYWNNPQASAKTVIDGWLHTGDVGYLDEDGFLYLTDRSKDVIISGGTNIYPREVEEVLLQHPGVSEVSVIGQPDEEWGEVVTACISTTEGKALSAAELDRYCLDHLARFKRPKHYHFFQELPKNSTGKILKTELRKRCLTDQPPSES